jgi:5,10-methylene-tetrahydrofolate dehydrogenase/methenyl tetrahydrofolate cyclohydrolase
MTVAMLMHNTLAAAQARQQGQRLAL